MPYLDTAQEWLTQSTLLLQARPTTTRITTKYTITPLISPSSPSTSPKKERKPKPTTSTSTTEPTTPAQPQDPIRATLTLKTYDAASHTSLKYSTTKAAEVSRLIQILGRLGRGMAGLPEKEDAVLGGEEGAAAVESVAPVAGKAGGQGGAAGKKGKKKGKK